MNKTVIWCAIALLLAAALSSGLAALAWVLGGGVAGFILGKTEVAIYRRVTHCES